MMVDDITKIFVKMLVETVAAFREFEDKKQQVLLDSIPGYSLVQYHSSWLSIQSGLRWLIPEMRHRLVTLSLSLCLSRSLVGY